MTIAGPNTNSNQTVTIPDGTGTLAVQGVSTNIVSGTAQASTSGTSIDFTGIPSWVKRITVMFNGVSTNGASQIQIQIGNGSIVTTGYNSSSWTSNTNNNSSTTGFILTGANNASALYYGNAFICLQTTNTWVESHAMGGIGGYNIIGGGSIALGGTLDRVRITTANGTDTFDAGSINILYE